MRALCRATEDRDINSDMKPGIKPTLNKTEPLKHKQLRPRKDGLGPCMSALSSLQKKFVIALFENPGISKFQALKLAGHAGGDNAVRKMVQRFGQNPLLNDAIREYGAAHFTGDLPLVIRRYHDVIDNPKHKDHGRLLKDAMDRIGPSTVKETKATVHHTFDREALLAKIANILVRQPDALKMIGQSEEQPVNVVDADYSEAVDSSRSDEKAGGRSD